MVDNLFPISSITEENIDFSKAVAVNSMHEIYQDIETSKCKCGGNLFPSGPINLVSPEGSDKNILYKLMILFCSKCLEETTRVYGVDTTSAIFKKEQADGFNSNPQWARLVNGNPTDTDEFK